MDLHVDRYKENISKENRENMIKMILERYVTNFQKKNSGSDEKKISIFIGGGSGSGKSGFRNDILEKHPDLLVIDADEMKELIPEYKDLQSEDPILAASIVHDESSDMANTLFNTAVDEALSFLFDGTLKSWEKYQAYFLLLKNSGFEINLIIIDVPVELAIERAESRYREALQENKSPRNVNVKIIENTHKQIPKSFENLKDHCDSWIIYDTEDDYYNPVAMFEDGVLQIINTSLYERFLNK